MGQHRYRQNNGGGRPSKGARYTRTIRFPVELHDAIEEAAAAAGYTAVNDFVVDVVARAREAGLFPAEAGQMELQASA